MKIVILTLVLLSIKSNDLDEGMNENDIIRESQTCGALKFNQEECI